MELVTKLLDGKTWPDFVRLAEDHHGVWDGYWCLNFHPEGAPRLHTPEERRALKEARVRTVSGSFLYNATVATFERHGFTRERRLGKHHWVVSRVVDCGLS